MGRMEDLDGETPVTVGAGGAARTTDNINGAAGGASSFGDGVGWRGWRLKTVAAHSTRVRRRRASGGTGGNPVLVVLTSDGSGIAGFLGAGSEMAGIVDTYGGAVEVSAAPMSMAKTKEQPNTAAPAAARLQEAMAEPAPRVAQQLRMGVRQVVAGVRKRRQPVARSGPTTAVTLVTTGTGRTTSPARRWNDRTLTPAEKLARVGLTVDDLKALLATGTVKGVGPDPVTGH